MHLNIPKRVWTVSVALMAALILGTGTVSAAFPSNVTITFNGATHDVVNHETNFSYDVSVGSGPGAKALSHLTLGVCSGIVPNGTESGLEDQWNPLPGGGTWRITPAVGSTVCGGNTIDAIVGTDPTTGVRGIKFECAGGGEFLDKGQSATFEYTVDGLWDEDPNIEVGAKAGPNSGTVAVGGPDCDSIDLSISTECANFDDPNPHYDSEVSELNGNPVTGVTFIDELPLDVAWNGTFTSTCASCGTVSCTSDNANPETVECELTSLPANTTWFIEINVDDNTSGPTLVTHDVSVSGNEAEAYTGNNDDECTTTTPVSLAYFQATRNGESVTFKWGTATESGNVGFNLYAKTSEGTWEQINDNLIPSSVIDSTEPQSYSFTAVVKGNEFRIEDADIYGNTRTHGAFLLDEMYGSIPESEPIDWAMIRSESAVKAYARLDMGHQFLLPDFADTFKRGRGKKQRTVQDQPQPIKVLVNQTGMQRLTAEALLLAGFNLTGVNHNDLALINKGRPVRIAVERNNLGNITSIDFYGEALDTLYTDTNVYYLLVDRSQALRIEQDRRKLRKVPPATEYTETTVTEKRDQYSASSAGDTPWYDERILAYGSSRSLSFTLDAGEYVAGTEAILSLEYYGLTDFPGITPDQHVIVELNGTQVAEEYSNGMEVVDLQAPVPAGLLQETGNTLRVTLVGGDHPYSMILINSYGVTYSRELVARDNQLLFSTQAPTVMVDGFDSGNLAVYQIENGVPTRIGNTQVQPHGGGYSVVFPGSESNETYLAVSKEAFVIPTVRPTEMSVDIKSAEAEFLIISHPDFMGDLGDLVRARRSQGWTVEVVDTEQIYEQFGDGIFGPDAIRKYIRFAVENKETGAVLLVGGDTYDYRDYFGQGAIGFIPTFYTRTGPGVGFAPVDGLYVDLDEDFVPDVPIGRFPVRTSEELAAVIQKTLAYGQKDYGRTAVFAADKRDIADYSAQSDALIAGLPAGWSSTRVYLDELDLATARTTLINVINNGVALASYAGHSGPTRWSFSNLLTLSDVIGLTNHNRPTVVVQYGCWTTYFASTTQNTLGHKFMASGTQGAAAVMGATTLTQAEHESRLGEILMPLLTEPGMTVGEALRQAQAALAASDPSARDVYLGFQLLGDPYVVVTHK